MSRTGANKQRLHAVATAVAGATSVNSRHCPPTQRAEERRRMRKKESERGETGIQTSSRQGWAGETASHLARN